MSFKDPQKVLSTIDLMVQNEEPRARNRARINAVFNGETPYTVAEAAAENVHTNVNFLEGTEVIHNARSQYANAFLKPANFFSVQVNYGPLDRRSEYSAIVTRNMNRIMKRSQRYYEVLENKFAGVVLHGVGPVIWNNDKDWCPKAFGVDEVLVPDRTLTDLSNLEYFAVRTTFTVSDLIRKISSGGSDVGWKEETVRAVVSNLREKTSQQSDSSVNDWRWPESFEEDIKENGGYWASEAAPFVRAWDFYYRDVWSKPDSDKAPWKRKILLDKQSSGATPEVNDPTLYEAKREFGEDLSKIMHVQFANGAVKPPFRWHSVRSLGYLIYAVSHLLNRMRCRLSDAVFENMLWYFRNAATGDEERLRKVDLHHLGLVPEGLSWVKPEERHTVDYNLVSGAISMYRQLVSERASNFTQDINDGTQKEMTATEAIGRINNASAMVGSMLTRSYTYETTACREIARRFCKIDHKDCKEFREKCEDDGVPKECWDHFDEWDIIMERTLGNGNKTLEVLQADRLRAMKNDAEMSPDARRTIDRLYIIANTDNPQLAEILIPYDQAKPSSAQEMATLAWGTLIDGKPVVIERPMNRIDYVRTLLMLLATDIQQINAAGGTPDIKRVQGLANVVQHISSNLEIIATDEGIADMVRAFGDALGQAANQIKGYMQRLQEQQAEAGQKMDPEVMAKVQAMMVTAQSQARIKEDAAEQKRRQSEMKFQQDQQRKNAATAADIQRAAARSQVELAGQAARTQAEIASKAANTAADIAMDAATPTTPSE